MDINVLARNIHEVNVQNGWWGSDDRVTEKLLMIHSEVSEAVDNYRHNIDMSEELADIVIRTLDLMEYLGVDSNEVVCSKLDTNRKRGYRHGGLKV